MTTSPPAPERATMTKILAATYIALVVTANLMTTHLGLLPAGLGLVVTAGTFAAGLVIAVRNPLQETGGRRWVVGCILVGAVLSLVLGTGRIGLASGATFLVAELLDMTVYTWLRRHGWKRAVIAGISVGAVADTLLFLTLAGFGLRDAMRAGELGMMCTEAEGRTPLVGYDGEPVWYAADNGCFAARGNLDVDRWLAWLTRLVAGREHRCLFAVAPDVFNPDLGDEMGAVSLAYSRPFLCDVRALSVPVALVAQNGLTPDMVPWEEIDWIFLGGTTEWKLSRHAALLCAAAREHGKGVHMGRVNSGRRWAIAEVFDCDTADGTFLAFGPDTNLPRLRAWPTPNLFGGAA